MEKSLLGAVLADRGVYEEVVRLGKEDGSSFSDLGKVIWKAAESYYKLDKGAKSIEREVLVIKLSATITNEKTFEIIKDVVNNLPAVSVPNVKQAYVNQRRDVVGQLLSSSLLGKDQTKTRKLLEEYNDLQAGNIGDGGDALEVYGPDDTRCLFDIMNRENLMRIRPLCLNDKIDGGAAKGDHIVIAGRVEDGKSLLAINMACGLAYDGHKGLYLCNEDHARRMRPRVLSRFSGKTKWEINEDREGALEIARQRGYNNFTFASQQPGSSLDEIERELERGKYDFVVIDQIRNVGADGDSKVRALESAALDMRELCKKYDVLGISVTQSNNSSVHINKLHEDMGDVADSKIGIPGQADLLIMMGSNDEFRERNQRCLSIVKNKLSGVHANLYVQINPHLSRVEDTAL